MSCLQSGVCHVHSQIPADTCCSWWPHSNLRSPPGRWRHRKQSGGRQHSWSIPHQRCGWRRCSPEGWGLQGTRCPLPRWPRQKAETHTNSMWSALTDYATFNVLYTYISCTLMSVNTKPSMFKDLTDNIPHRKLKWGSKWPHQEIWWSNRLMRIAINTIITLLIYIIIQCNTTYTHTN